VIDKPVTQILLEQNGNCGIMLIMIKTGFMATAVVTMKLFEWTLIILPPLYVTGGGDESIGLSLAMPLILSNERLRALIKETLFGTFDMLNILSEHQSD
jgi:hypothetical protein